MPGDQIKSKKIFRIVVASPSDVRAEREALAKVVDELNHGIASDKGLTIELTRWEIDSYPGFDIAGPQGLVDKRLMIRNCDLLIGIFWRRFGSPVKDAKSGTQHEFDLAFRAWKRQRRPQIMFYFNQKHFSFPKGEEEITQLRKVQEFKESFSKEGFWWDYQGTTQFISVVRRHLTDYILNGKPQVSRISRQQGSHGAIQPLRQESTKNLEKPRLASHVQAIRSALELHPASSLPGPRRKKSSRLSCPLLAPLPAPRWRTRGSIKEI